MLERLHFRDCPRGLLLQAAEEESPLSDDAGGGDILQHELAKLHSIATALDVPRNESFPHELQQESTSSGKEELRREVRRKLRKKLEQVEASARDDQQPCYRHALQRLGRYREKTHAISQ